MRRRLFAALLFAFILVSPVPAARAAVSGGAIQGVPTLGAVGVAERISDIMRRQALADAAGQRPERDAEEKENEHPRPDRTHLPQNPASLDAGSLTGLPFGALSAGGGNTIESPQAIGTSFTAATLSGTNPTSSFPPDCMGAVGPTQVVVFVNGRLVTFNKSTGVADGALNADPDVFFSTVRNGSITSDPRIRYDRLTGRWFLIIINTSTPNRILLAVSAAGGSSITGSTVFTKFFIPINTTPPTISSTCFADYPTLGLDANALYIGTNDFCGASGAYNGTDAYVVRKSSIMGAGPIVVTAFRQLATASGAGPYTPQGVDNYDPNATEGYFIGSDNASYGLLELRRVTNPGGTPTLSANIPITVSATNAPIKVPHLGNTGSTAGQLDCLDDRLFAAHIRNGQLWTAHNIGVTNTGSSAGTMTRDGSRWYHLNVPAVSGTPTVVESGTLYTPSASNTTDQRSYWIPSIMVSGQGHAAMGFCAAGTNERANTGAVGRWVTDAASTLQTPTLITSSATAYNPPGDPGDATYGRRWGDYSYVSLDPIDDMTMWSVSMFCDATNSYGVRATKLIAPPPAAPATLADITAGQSSVTLTLTGTASSGSGFYDPGANLAGVPAFNHLAAAVSNGAATGTPPAVVSATYLTPTTVQLVLNASAATANVASEKYTVTITNPDGQTAASAIVHVIANALPVATIATGPTGNEGNAGNTPFDFTVNLTAASASSTTIRYQTSDGSATVADNDYVAAIDSITIAAGLTAGTIHVNVKGDGTYEPNETFGVTLTGATGATLGATVAATGTITNDDPLPTLAIVASAATAEGNSGTTALLFAVTLSNASYQAASASWATSDNSATTADGDYAAGSGTVTIPAGSLSANVSVNVNGDLKYENNESFNVTLTAPAGASLGNAVANGTITNDDAPPALSIGDVAQLEGNSGTSLYHFTVSLPQASALLTSVDWTTADGSATTANADYVAGSGTLSIPAGATSGTIDVTVNGDGTREPDETFTVVLSNAVSATIASGTGTGTIQNDDATPLLAIAAATTLEGNAGTHPLVFNVSLTNPSSSIVTVHYATSDGSATVGNGDYAAASGTLNIPAFATSGTVSVDVAGDACGEPDETFTVTLSGATNAAIATPSATGTIQNDDDVAAPVAAVLAPNGGESVEVAGTTNITWTASDSAGVTGVDLVLSRDGGATFTETLASGLANTGTYAWTVTAPATTSAFVRVLAHDAGCNTGSDASDAAFTIADHVTSVDLGGPVTEFALGTVRPNPSRGAVALAYQLPRSGSVRLSVVDVQGREIAVLANGATPAGRHTATWSGLTANGLAPHGLYFVRYAAGGKVFTRRFALLR